jgi:hypothetical protein
VLDTLGAHDLGFGDDVPYVPDAWAQVERRERPRSDDLAEAFFHLARLEERNGPHDRHGRFLAAQSCLDPLDPPLERLRRRLGVEPPRWRGARFALALTHDVDIPWRWTRLGIRGAAARGRDSLRRGRFSAAFREARGLAAVPLHKIRGSDPNWAYERLFNLERRRGGDSTFFVMAGHGHPADGPARDSYEELRPRLVETIRAGGGEIALHGSYRAAEDEDRLAAEKAALERLAGPVMGQRFHYLRIDPHGNVETLERVGFHYDATLGFADELGFRAGIAHPFRPWAVEEERVRDLVAIPLAAMDVTLSEERYLGLSAARAWPRLQVLLDRAAEQGGGFAVLWHTDRFDRWTASGWDRLYARLLDEVRARGGICMSARDLAEEAAAWLR